MEIWKDIDGFVGVYQVSNLGRIKSLPKYTYSKGYPQLRKEKILKPCYTGRKRCYATVRLNDGKSYKVHRLVAQAFIPNPHDLPLVNHKDENPKNNCVDNLEWCDYRYNRIYSAKPLSAVHRKKIGDSHNGKRLSNAHKKSISVSMRRRYLNPEERKKTSAAITEWWRLRKADN